MKKKNIFVIFLIILSSSVIALTGDFDDNGAVEFSDFTLFAKGFNDYNQDGKYDPLFDLNNDTNITITDFFIFSDNYGKTNETNVSLRPAALSKPLTLLRGDFDGSGCVDNNDFNFAENEIKNWINEIKTLPAEYEYAIDCSTAGTKKVADSQCWENGAHVYEIGKTKEAIIYLPSEREIPRGAENDYIKSLTCLVRNNGFSLGYSTIREPRFYPGGNQLIPRRISACYEEKKLKFDNIHSIAQSQGDIVYLNSFYLNKFGDKSTEFNDLFIGYNLYPDTIMWDANDKEEFKKLLGQGCVAPETLKIVESFASCNNFQNDEDKNKCLIISASKHTVVNEYCFDDNKNFDESKCTPENIGICDSIKDSINRQNEINLKKICNEKYKLYVEARDRVL